MSSILTRGPIERLGGKAFAQARLQAQGLPVPEWFAIAPDAFLRSLPPEHAAALASGNIELIQSAIADLRVAPAVAEEIRRAIAALGPGPFAVRSSAVEEDGAGDSFAGQLASYLFVSADAVADRVADVWRSGFTPQVGAYRTQRGLTPCPKNPPAVLVQRMVNAECSGVAFSADPISGRSAIAVVSAVFGMGTALVGGEADADLYHVDRSGTIVKRAIAHKQLQHRQSNDAPEGVAPAAVAEELRDAPVLSDEMAAQIAMLARRSAVLFGQPQDMEWAIASERIYALQSRPITTLRSLPDPDGVLNIWDNSNIIESYSGITTPLTFSFARAIYEGVYRQFCRVLRVPERKIAAHARTFSSMLGLIQGRVYYNLLNWYRVLALLPGFTANRRFMEQMMGVRESLPPDIASQLAAASRKEKLADLFALGRMVLALAWNLFGLERSIARFEARLEDALRDPSPALSEMRLDELAECYLQLERELLSRWDAPLINDFFAMIFHGALRKLTLKWLGDQSGMLANDLIRGHANMISVEHAMLVRELATLASSHPQLVRSLRRDPLEDVMRAMSNFPEFRAAYDAYLARFGDRCMEELKLESESLHQNPLVLLRSIGELAASPSHVGNSARSANDAEENALRGLGRSPLKRALFKWVLRHARARVAQRENLRFQRTRLFGRVRSIFRECGKRLYAMGKLASPQDIFYLQVEEVLSYVNGTAVTANLAALAALRRREFAAYEASPVAPAERFETRGPVYHAQSYQRAQSESMPVNTAEDRTGIGCCAGVVRGIVTVVRDPRNARFPAGRILVAEHTDPGWIMLFPSAIGLLVERGSLLSHSAVVARELGIPAVVSIRGLTAWLNDGDEVELDGARGTVRRISNGDAHAR